MIVPEQCCGEAMTLTNGTPCCRCTLDRFRSLYGVACKWDPRVIVTCRHPCAEADGKPLCRLCQRQADARGEAMAALIDDGPQEQKPAYPGELGHVRASEAS